LAIKRGALPGATCGGEGEAVAMDSDTRGLQSVGQKRRRRYQNNNT